MRKLERQNHVSVDLQVMDTMIHDMEATLKQNPTTSEYNQAVKLLLDFQAEDGSFSLLDSFKVPSDIRVDYCYRPTYLGAAILMKALLADEAAIGEEGKTALANALAICSGRNLRGHGYEALAGQLQALGIFRKGGVREFLQHYPNLCPDFTAMMKNIIKDLRHMREFGTATGAWGEDYGTTIDRTLNYFDMHAVFVYGTLLAGEANHDAYLSDSRRVGKATLDGYELYDLGSYPGIVSGTGTVKGEVYKVTDDVLAEMDRLEGEGSLYLRRPAMAIVEPGVSMPVQVYVYNHDVSGCERIPEECQPYTSTWKEVR